MIVSARLRKCLAALLVLLLGGLIRLPLERSYTATLQEQHLADAKLDLSLREELGQSFFIAVLGGFRSIVASIIELQILDDYHQHNFAKVEAGYALCTRIQPREYHYWEFRAWMNTTNAWEYYKYQDESRPGIQPWIRQNLVDDGIAILKEGMRYLPGDYRLPRTLGLLYADFEKNRNANYYEAAQWFYKAWQLRPSHRFLWRNYVYNLARAPGHEAEAWPLLIGMYNTGPHPASDRTSTGITLLVQLYPTVKAQLPTAELPPEVAASRDKILAEQHRRDQAAQDRIRRDAEAARALEEALLQSRQR